MDVGKLSLLYLFCIMLSNTLLHMRQESKPLVVSQYWQAHLPQHYWNNIMLLE